MIDVLPPPERPTRPTRSPSAMRRSSPSNSGAAWPRVGEADPLEHDARGARRARAPGTSGSSTVGGSSSSSANCAASVTDRSSWRQIWLKSNST